MTDHSRKFIPWNLSRLATDGWNNSWSPYGHVGSTEVLATILLRLIGTVRGWTGPSGVPNSLVLILLQSLQAARVSSSLLANFCTWSWRTAVVCEKKPNCQLGRPLRICLVRLAKFFFPSLPHWSSNNDRNSDKNGGGGERNQRCPFERQYRDQVKSRSRAEDRPADRGGWILWSYSNYVRFRSNVLYRSFWSQTVFLFTVRIGQRSICRH